MKGYRSKLLLCGVISCLCLTGFKQHTQKTAKLHPKEDVKQQKTLDLSLPKRQINFQDPPEIIAKAQVALPGVDINDKNKDKPLELKGNVIMSQELEAEKMKSADGAGIVINLRH